MNRESESLAPIETTRANAELFGEMAAPESWPRRFLLRICSRRFFRHEREEQLQAMAAGVPEFARRDVELEQAEQKEQAAGSEEQVDD
jgi:hypothetical protein